LFSNKKWIELIENSGLKVVKKGANGWWDVPYLPIIPGFIQLIIFAWPAAVQILVGKIILPSWLGVELLLVVRKT